ncbi:MAG: DUF3995 domain-containing protein, partial [Thermoleophilaceae bacterium]|nr:DUF3995 domain-containing protein [Thermoleophilaceae bacterium]
MKIHNVHSRELPGTQDQIGALIDDLGTPEDRLWPTDRWTTTPLELDGPLAVGTQSRQGLLRLTQMRQVVDVYEPGRRIEFRFTPGLGIVGTHRLEVQPLGADRTRLTHTLDCRVEAKMLPLYPILIRVHDALVEDILDRAELAIRGSVDRPASWPRSVRIYNAVEHWAARRLRILPPARGPRSRAVARFSGVAVPAVLLAVAVLHAAWALGWFFPAGGERELAEHVLSRGEREQLDGKLPPAPITWAVALALAGAAGVVRAVVRGTRSRMLRRLAWGVAAVFLVRGVAYLPSDLSGGLEDSYQRLDLMIYSPLCLSLAAGTGIVLRRTGVGPDANT